MTASGNVIKVKRDRRAPGRWMVSCEICPSIYAKSYKRANPGRPQYRFELLRRRSLPLAFFAARIHSTSARHRASLDAEMASEAAIL